MPLQRRAQPLEPRLLRQGAEQHALGIPDVQNDGGDRLPGDRDRGLPDARGHSHGRTKRLADLFPADARKSLRPGLRLNRQLGVRAVVVAEREGRERANAVPGHFRPAAVGIEEAHRHAVVHGLVDDQPVGADTGMAITHLPGERVEGRVLDLRLANVQEVVAVRVGLGESNHRRIGELVNW